ncbi:MAG: hypothetical protein RIT45_2436 [Pseudomonadota bacterium]|jgi:MYXO-CTERM domain-containing protein
MRVYASRFALTALAAGLLATACQGPDTATVAAPDLAAHAPVALQPNVVVLEESPLVAAETAVLPAFRTAAERLDQAKNDAADDYRNANPYWFAQTKPLPTGEYRPFGEWEEMSQVWTTYSAGMPSTKPVRRMFAEQTINFIRHSKPQVEAKVIVASQSIGNDFMAALDENGATADEKKLVELVVVPNQTIWHIDYGPFPLIRKADNVLAFSDFVYYHPRQIDDAIPTRLAQDYFGDVSVYRMPFPFEGGNIQADSVGKCATTNRALANTGFSASKVRNLLKHYAACEETFIVKDISDDGTGHIDMFFKWSKTDEVIFGEYYNELTLDYDGDGKDETLPMPGYAAADYKSVHEQNQKRMNDNAELFAAATASTGKKFVVHRLPMMTRYKDEYGNLPRTFINSTFTNGVNVYPSYTTKSCQAPNGAKCMVDADCAAGEHCAAGKCTKNPNGPTTEGCDEMVACPTGLECVEDPFKVALIAKAQQAWEKAMPEWKHVGLRADTIGLWSGAIHCITRTIPKATHKKIVDDAICTGGRCACVEGGADNACTKNAECFGPAWVCNCNICYGTCSSNGAKCTDDADCAANGAPVVDGSCVQDRQQACPGQSGGSNSDCGDTPWEGVCDGKSLKFCKAGKLSSLSCAGCCGWSDAEGSTTCLAGDVCSNACIPECPQAGSFGCSAEGSHAWTCVDEGGCLKRKYTNCGNNKCDTGAGKCLTGDAPAPVCPGDDAGSTGDDASTGGDDASNGGDDATGGGGDSVGGTDTTGGGSTGGGSGGGSSSGCSATRTGQSGMGWMLVLAAIGLIVGMRRRRIEA